MTTALVTVSLPVLPLLRPGFVARAIRVGFMVDEKALGQVSLQVIPIYSNQYHSTIAPHSLIYTNFMLC